MVLLPRFICASRSLSQSYAPPVCVRMIPFTGALFLWINTFLKCAHPVDVTSHTISKVPSTQILRTRNPWIQTTICSFCSAVSEGVSEVHFVGVDHFSVYPRLFYPTTDMKHLLEINRKKPPESLRKRLPTSPFYQLVSRPPPRTVVQPPSGPLVDCPDPTDSRYCDRRYWLRG